MTTFEKRVLYGTAALTNLGFAMVWFELARIAA